jgi:hypothetical protein
LQKSATSQDPLVKRTRQPLANKLKKSKSEVNQCRNLKTKRYVDIYHVFWFALNKLSLQVFQNQCLENQATKVLVKDVLKT